MLPAKYIDGGPSPEKIQDHLRGDSLGIGVYQAGGGDAMVGCKDDDMGMMDLRPERVLDPTGLQGQFFQPSQGAQGLCLVIYPVLECC
jgi:hypothetical protein